MLKQKLAGITLAVIGGLSIIPECDITIAILFIPLGVYIAITKRKVVD